MRVQRKRVALLLQNHWDYSVFEKPYYYVLLGGKKNHIDKTERAFRTVALERLINEKRLKINKYVWLTLRVTFTKV